MVDNILTVTDENGQEIECEILFTFDSEAYGKNYVVYMPIGDEFIDEDGFPHIHVSSFTEEDAEGGSLAPITDDEEWDMIEEVVESFIAEQEAEDEGNPVIS